MTAARDDGLTRRDLLRQAAAAGAGLGLGFPAILRAAGRGRPPNLVIVLADQMRGQATGCMGNDQIRTPHMDRLARQGALFRHAYSGFPVCTPYRAMMLTGRYGQKTGVVTNTVGLPDGEDTIAEMLRKRGYKTGYVGKWHLEWNKNPFVPIKRRQGFVDFWAVRNINHLYFNSFVCMDTPDRYLLPGYEPDGQTALAIDFLHLHRKEPFCLVLSWGPPHPPYTAPEPYRSMYDPKTLKQRPNVKGDHRRDLARYYGMISNLDRNLGRLLNTLHILGLAEDTIVVFTSDHGNMLGSQRQLHKQRPWEEAIRIPFIVRYPRKIRAGIKTDALINSVDVLPTLLGLMGARAPGDVQGRDLSAFARGKRGGAPDSILLQNILPSGQAVATGIKCWRGLRTPQYTYARWRGGPWLLYDNLADPYQLRNLARDPGSAGIRRKLDRELSRWLERTSDDFAPEKEWKRRLRKRRAAEGLPPWRPVPVRPMPFE
jgi:arylsulfatase A-like enzyme